MNDTMSEDRLLAEKKMAFTNACKKLEEAYDLLEELDMLQDLRKRLTDEQRTAIYNLRQTYCTVKICCQELQAGRSK
ncbi:MAG: hypothetical protein ACI4Q4_03550 [Oscillospiraceae bacterium]